MVDVTGLVERQLQIVPDKNKLAVLGLSIQDVETALAQNNVEPGSMTVRDGYYEYNIKFSTLLRTEDDVKNILINKESRIIRLEEFCEIGVVSVKEKGISMSNGKRAVTLAIIKQADEKMYIRTSSSVSVVIRRNCWIIPSPIYNRTFRWASSLFAL